MYVCSLGAAWISGDQSLTNLHHILQDRNRCDPKGRECIEKNFSESFDCLPTCEGVYADLQWLDEQLPTEEDDGERENKALTVIKAKLSGIMDQYNKYKKTTVRHFRFNASAINKTFGKAYFYIL